MLKIKTVAEDICFYDKEHLGIKIFKWVFSQRNIALF